MCMASSKLSLRIASLPGSRFTNSLFKLFLVGYSLFAMDDHTMLPSVKYAIMAGVGLFILIKLLNYIKRLNDPLSHKRIEVIQSVDDCQKIVNVLKSHCRTLNVLGFDCEWVTVGRKRRRVALLQLASGKGLCALFRLCCMRHIPKSLRDLLGDREVLKVGVDPGGDANKIFNDYGVAVASTYDLRFLTAATGAKPEGLARMSKSVLNVVLDKDWRLSCSNWDDKELADYQLHYAANDALVAIEIFKKLSDRVESTHFWQSSPGFARIRLFLDVGFKEGSLTNNYIWNRNEDLCIVCAHNVACIRKNVVPREYLEHYPVVMKTHSSQEVVPLCFECHVLSNVFDLRISHELAKICNAPLPESRQVKSAAIALLNHGGKISKEIKTELEYVVLKYYNEMEISDNLLQKAAFLVSKESNENSWTHSEMVVYSFQYELGGGLVELEKLCRRCFWKTMHPEIIPGHWYINYGANR